ncbi:MAG TPA: hypothetical protein VGV13_06375 [Methylomirabilota bacterium]|jgi:hypothetical protein|nr:hypothetical protein [Methylomirabilota bacterium]
MAAPSLYFHSPCFDGIASAVLAWDFLETRGDWTNPILRAVNYDQRGHWLTSPLKAPAAVVDFLYHPNASFWADHHLTTFLDAAAQAHFSGRREPWLLYDAEADSCAGLLWRRFLADFGHRNALYADLVAWADKLDAARYESVDEAITGTTPALRLALGLAAGDPGDYCETLVRALRDLHLEEVANLPTARERYAKARALFDAGLDRFKRAAHLEGDDIVVFDVDATDVLVSRYAPYYFYPHARYSIGITRLADSAKVTAMRNPWYEFPSVPLGRIAEGLGGGGHQRVAAVLLQGEQAAHAGAVLCDFLAEIRKHERRGGSRPP